MYRFSLPATPGGRLYSNGIPECRGARIARGIIPSA